jgi:hypothetical protein
MCPMLDGRFIVVAVLAVLSWRWISLGALGGIQGDLERLGGSVETFTCHDFAWRWLGEEKSSLTLRTHHRLTSLSC